MTQQEELKRATTEFQNCFMTLNHLVTHAVVETTTQDDLDTLEMAANNVARAAKLWKLNLMQAEQEKGKA